MDFFDGTHQLREAAFAAFCASLPCFLVGLGATFHIRESNQSNTQQNQSTQCDTVVVSNHTSSLLFS